MYLYMKYDTFTRWRGAGAHKEFRISLISLKNYPFEDNEYFNIIEPYNVKNSVKW